ncbi:MAG: endonuclease IV [Clostridiales bacterium]|nr:endonuclease IV [Clostridiales bacterium]
MAKLLFGPSGNSESFYEQGYKSTLDTPKWLEKQGKSGLDLFEYSFGQGYRMSTDKAEAIGEEFKKANIEMSVHAPYFINFANPDEEMYLKSLGYIKTGIKFLKAFGAKRLIFHSGSCGKETRENAISLMTKRFIEFMPMMEQELDPNMFLCPETMGKPMQIGTYKEIVDLCTISDKLLPTFDFGHINSLTQGSLKVEEDYQKIFDYSFEKLGEDRTKNCHIHFSKIQYGAKGEIRHLNFDDFVYGPDFEPLCNVLIKNNMCSHIVCESAGKQAEDSLFMKELYLSKTKNA